MARSTVVHGPPPRPLTPQGVAVPAASPPSPRRRWHRNGWTLASLSALAWAGVIALLLSTQYLAQLYVWRHWPVAEVLEGWLYVLRDRLVVALPIALLLVVLGRLPLRSDAGRAGALATAILVGSLAGETGLHLLDDRSLDSMLFAGSALRWALMAAVLAAMYWLWRSMARTREAAEREALRALDGERRLAQARLAALQSQIEPHFLFNTLATVRRLQRTGPNEGAAMLGSFIGYLRQTMALLDRNEVRLESELALVREYLAVIKVRMSGRLQVQIDVPPALGHVLLPPLALTTLVENAVKHGLTPAPAGGALAVVARETPDGFEIAVADTGVGFGGAKTGGSGLGLSNVRSRLQALHGNRAQLVVAANRPTGVVATMRLPVARGEAQP